MLEEETGQDIATETWLLLPPVEEVEAYLVEPDVSGQSFNVGGRSGIRNPLHCIFFLSVLRSNKT